MALTEKGTQRIVIIVRKQTDGGQVGTKTKEADNASNEAENKENGVGTKSNRTFNWWKTQLTHTAAVAKQWAQAELNYQIAGIGYKFGDQSLQNSIERTVERVSDVANIASSVAMGATYGATGGPIGMAVGALMMGAQTAMTMAYKYRGRQRDYDIQIFKQENAIEYKRARAQINLTTGRLR